LFNVNAVHALTLNNFQKTVQLLHYLVKSQPIQTFTKSKQMFYHETIKQ